MTTNLDQLQSLIKRDPKAYREDFLQQQKHFLSIFQIFLLKPTQEHENLNTLVKFISQVCVFVQD